METRQAEATRLLAEAVAPFKSALEAHGRATTWPIEWSNRMVRGLGKAHLMSLRGVYVGQKITLSAVHWPHLTPEERKNLVYHEACHMVSCLLYGRAGAGHGDWWKLCMLKLGLNPERCADPSTGNQQAVLEMRRRRKSFDYTCGCQTYNLSTVRHNRILQGAVYRCRKCGKQLVRA